MIKTPRVYIETTVISYLVSRPSRDLVSAANQQLTREWWENRRKHFDLVISEVVVQECQQGNRDAARARSALTDALPLLELTDDVRRLAAALLKTRVIPAVGARDALHISAAAIHAVDYLLTWNCTHIANAEIRRGIARVAAKHGYGIPVMCTPLELMGRR